MARGIVTFTLPSSDPLGRFFGFSSWNRKFCWSTRLGPREGNDPAKNHNKQSIELEAQDSSWPLFLMPLRQQGRMG